MSASDLFPEAIVPAEQAAGFFVAEITNPDAHYAFAPETMKAVILPIDASHRIIKMRDPVGGISYEMQQFGKFDFERPQSTATWRPCGDDFDLDPQDAADNAARRIASGTVAGFRPMTAPPRDLGE